MKKLVLAEKPSVGRELARVLGCVSRGNFFENEDYVITWALGHLVTLCPPDKYGSEFKRWSVRNLPILPEKLETMVIEKTRDQFDLVSGLMNREDVDLIIIATDAGREGELVARWILQQGECTKPIKRLWISSQTDSAIKAGFENLKDGHDYDNLFFAARSRSFADWYIGYNVSRAMTCHFDTKLSAGRVQTPTLALVTAREDEIENFTGKFFWTVRADFGTFKASRYSEDKTVKIPTEEEADGIVAEIENAQGSVTSVKKVPSSEKPPLAYDLTELQRDANTILGFSAKKTLDVLQRLYEVHKIVTYPRTDSRYITDDIVPTIGDRLLALTDTPFAAKVIELSKTGIRTDLSRLVDNSMVSDHHALLPTEQKVNLSKLSQDEKSLWDLVIRRFLQTLCADYEYFTTTVEAQVGNQKFSARVTVPSVKGWRELALSESSEDEQESALLSLKEGDALTVKAVEKKRGATPAPSRFTEADLLYAMEHAGKYVEDEQLKKRLENGLGTPATRADIIEKLIQNNCMERRGTEIVPTPKGRELVRLVPPQLQSAELTGKWEQRLFNISNGNENEELFLKDIKQNAADLVKQVISSREHFNPELMGNAGKNCPHCGWPMLRITDEFDRVHRVCQRFSCSYEEMDVPKKVEKPAIPSSITVSPVKKTVASVKSESESGKKTLIIKKSAVQAMQSTETTWETVTEVVRESRYRPQHNMQQSSAPRNKDRNREHRPDNREKTGSRPFRSDRTDRSDSGGTFADFIRAAEERKKRDEERRKKKTGL